MPSPVDKYFDQVKKENPSYSDAQAWATAWSIYCKHKNPGSDHCHKDPSEYLKGRGKKAGLLVRVASRFVSDGSSMAERVAERFAAKGKTFDQARVEILAHLKKEGWKVTDGLKIPHATSPSGELRLWFKKQAVYFTEGNLHTFGGARSTWIDDIRKMDGPKFLAEIKRQFPKST